MSWEAEEQTRDLLHKVSRAIVDVAKALSAGAIIEDLDGIKNGSWPARRLQLYVDYKARLADLPAHYVNHKAPRAYAQCAAVG